MRRTDAAIVAALLALFVALGGHIIRQVVAYPLPGGWDGTAHYAVTELYVRHHFPAPGGWMPEYFGGMAFPDYYPPLLYWLAGGLATLGVPTAAAIDLVFVASTVAVIVLSYAIALRLARSRVAAALATVIVIQLLVDGGEQARFGIAIRGTFSVGLASHVVGYAMLLAAIRCALAETARRRVLGTAACLALAVLANLHVTLDAAIVVGLAAAFQLAWGAPGRRLEIAVAGMLGLAASSVFWLPLLAESRWLPTYAMPPRFPGTAVIVPMAAISAIAGAWAVRAKEVWTAAIAAMVLVCAALCVVDLSRIVPGAPLQPWRIAAAGIFLAPIALAPAAASALAWRGHGGRRARIGQAVVAIAFAAYALTFHRAREFEYPLTTAREQTYDRVFAALAGRSTGRVLVEAGGDGADAYALSVLLPLHGHDSATGVFREASLGSLFAIPLQSRFSESARVFGIDSNVDMNVFFAVTSPIVLGGVLRELDITHVVAHSPRIKALLATFPGVRMLGGTDYSVYELPWAPERVVSPSHEPVLVAAPFTVKRRTGTTDFIRLSEELLARGVADYTVALQHGCALVDRAQLAKFRAVLILERCGGVDDVGATLRAYLAAGGIVIANARALAGLPADVAGADGITAIGRDDDALAFYDGVVAALRARVPTHPLDPIGAYVDRDSVALSVPPGQVTPVVIRATYHPSWVADHGDVYMSTFAQTLVLADGPTIVERRRSRPRVVGAIATLLTLVFAGFTWRRLGSSSR